MWLKPIWLEPVIHRFAISILEYVAPSSMCGRSAKIQPGCIPPTSLPGANAGGKHRWASEKVIMPRLNCLKLFEHEDRRAASLAACTAGKSSPTSVPIIAITTKSSTSVKAAGDGRAVCCRRWSEPESTFFFTANTPLEKTIRR